ncbi:MAG: DUF4405 domain-containing protein [Burkholderiales bacterium]|nr:MAG: DUF4405 domain-containing protein [Burkholderiales bacterium]
MMSTSLRLPDWGSALGIPRVTTLSMTTASNSRRWATPVVMASFAFMAATGVLMFFHWHSPLQKELHEWLGWALVTAVLLHVLSNVAAFKRHFAGQRLAAVLLGAVLLVVAGTSFIRPAESKGGSVSAVAVQALAKAPLPALAQVFGLSTAQARQALSAAGLDLPQDSSTLDAAAQGQRERIGKGLKALAAALPTGSR